MQSISLNPVEWLPNATVCNTVDIDSGAGAVATGRLPLAAARALRETIAAQQKETTDRFYNQPRNLRTE